MTQEIAREWRRYEAVNKATADEYIRHPSACPHDHDVAMCLACNTLTSQPSAICLACQAYDPFWADLATKPILARRLQRLIRQDQRRAA